VLASVLVFSPLLLLLLISYWPLHHGAAAILAVPILWTLQTLMVLCMAIALSILTTALRDTTQFLAFALQMGIFLSPALFPYAQFPEAWRWVLWLNPMTPFLLGYQASLLQGMWPDYTIWFGILAWLVLFAAMAKTLHSRSKDHLVDWL
jgi:lipopolysaccharide transport system permease protein